MTPSVLPDLFLASAARHARLPAVDVPPGRDRSERQVVAYADLLAMADAVRRRLMPHVSGEAMVVVLLPRTTPWLYAAQLGVLFAGGAHVCLDGTFPDAHLAHVVRDTAAVAVVTDAAGALRLAAAGIAVPVVAVPLAFDRGAAPPPDRPAWSSPHGLAYVIYTSGTTGAPKGVLLEHAGAVNLIRAGVARFGLGPGDRIAQGSSPAYDSSIEETWLALASGATAVVLDDETVRLGPDLVPWLARERITVLCPPPTLLRTLGCRSPRQALPELRLCYVGGEPLPADLAATWGAALWLENGYGPTECTVTVVRGRVASGEPVTIGTPVPPHVAWLCDEQLRPVPDGEPGELCIAGPGLARGYLGNASLTAERFPTVPGLGRIYRTGDLVCRDPDGRLRHLGRIDAQVKLRGYRIELEAIEAVLARCDGVREAACAVRGEEPAQSLGAWIVPRDAGSPPDAAALRAAVARELPPYMVPARFVVLATLPRTVGGKVDRKALPELDATVAAPAAAPVANGSADLGADPVRVAFAAVLGLAPHAVDERHDFFVSGGDSLRAALLVSRLRQVPGCERVAVRDVYTAPTIAGLRECIAARAAESAPATNGSSGAVSAGHPLSVSAGQIAFLGLRLAIGATVAYASGFVLLPWLLATFSLPVLLFFGPWLVPLGALAVAAATLWAAVLAKELLIGRYRPTRVSAWSGFALRHWCVVGLARLVPWRLFVGTELHVAALRALGARIGRRVHIDRGVDLTAGGWDLLELGDDVMLGRDADIGLCELDAGDLVVGAVRLAAGAALATRAGTGPDVEVGARAAIGPLSFVAPGARVPAGEAWHGVPARGVGPAPAPPPCTDAVRELTPWRHTLVVMASRLLLLPALAMPLALATWFAARQLGIDNAAIAAWLCGDGPLSQPVWCGLALALAVFGLIAWLVELALLLRWLPKVPAGTHPRWCLRHAWLQQRSAWLELAGTWLSGSLFWPWWLRLAGMRVGRDVEVSTITAVLPEHTAIGGGSFLADGIYLGAPALCGGRVTVAPTALGERTFVGNHVVVPAGERLPDDLLLGVATVADHERMGAGSAWFGLPPFPLPRREVIAIDRRLTHEPGALRYANRLLWEAARALLPAVPVALTLWWFALVAPASDGGLAVGWAAAALGLLSCGAAAVGLVLAAKWLLLGRVRPGQHGLWSCWASRWDFLYVLWQRIARPLLQPLEGTLLLPWYLRAMGMKIGRGCVLGQGFAQVVDPDMIAIGDGATVHALFQAHSFEDRVLKIDRVRIDARSTVGRAAVLLYGAHIGERAHVMAHSVVMKREVLLPGRRYAGAPTVEANGDAAGDRDPAAAGTVAVDGASPAPGRDAALDAARGLAVLGMVWLHFVPLPRETDDGIAAAALRASLTWLEGVPAMLFVFLAGVAWLAPGARPAAWVVRRSLALVALGFVFWRFVWPNDVLAPLGLMLPLVVALCRGGPALVAAAILLLVLAVPPATALWGHFVAADCLDDGTHVANHAFGMATVRWFVFDGAYPLLPWLCLPLLGSQLARVRGEPARLLRWFWLALPLPFVASACTALAADGDADLGGLEAYLAVTWQPTSLPFVLRCGGAAIALVAGLGWWTHARGLPRWLAPVAAVGRASLTHYLAHVVVVYTALRWWWPAEDWPVRTGVLAAVGYGAFAMVGSALWFRRCRRGPLEALLRWWSGRSRP